MTHVPPDIGKWLRELAEDRRLGAIPEHLAACRERGLTPATLASKLLVLRRAHAALAPAGLLDATERQVRRWWRTTTYRGLAPATRVKELAHLRVFYAWALREDLRPDDPTRRIDAPRVGRRLPRPADHQAVRRLLAKLSGSEWLAIALATYAGLRVAEITRVRPGDVRLAGAGAATLHVIGKGNFERVVPIPETLARRLLELPAGEPAVRGRYGQPFTPDGLSRAVARILRGHGLDATAHRLRHTYGTRAYAASRDLLSVQRLLGHAQPATTAGYAAVSGAASATTCRAKRAASAGADDGRQAAM